MDNFYHKLSKDSYIINPEIDSILERLVHCYNFMKNTFLICWISSQILLSFRRLMSLTIQDQDRKDLLDGFKS